MILNNKDFREHTSGLLVAADGEIYVPRTKGHFEHFTYGSVNGRGYKQVRFKGKVYRVHRLVAECYLENPDNKPCVDHINMQKDDNRVENLRWCTHQENLSFSDQDVQKRKVANTDWKAFAEKVSKKLTNRTDQSKQVIQLDLEGNEIARFPSASEVKRQLGFFQTAISNCCNGKRKTAYKSKWRYA